MYIADKTLTATEYIFSPSESIELSGGSFDVITAAGAFEIYLRAISSDFN